MPGMPLRKSAVMLTIGAAVLLHALQEQLAHHQEAAGQVVGHHRVEAALADRHAAATGTARRRC